MVLDKKYLDVYVWAEKEGGLYGSWHYAFLHNKSFLGGGNTPTISTSHGFWEEVIKKTKKLLGEKNLEECCLYDGIVPPLEEWKNTRSQQIPIVAHNYFLLKLPINNYP